MAVFITGCERILSAWCKTFLVKGDADAVGELAALCVKGKQQRVAPRYVHAHERSQKQSKIGISVITMQHMDVVHLHVYRTPVYRAQARRKRISFTEFLTLLRLLTKKAFMNGNKYKSSDSFFHRRSKPCRVVAAGSIKHFCV